MRKWGVNGIFYDFCFMCFLFITHRILLSLHQNLKIIIMEQKNELISQSNILTESRYDFDPIGKRCIYAIIQKVRKDYIEGESSLFNNMHVKLPTASLLQIVDEKHTKQAKEALKRLRKRDIEIEDAQGNWLICGFINWAQYDATKKYWQVEVSSQIMPHLVELASKFTTYSLTVAISLKSKWAQRFYEMCCQYRSKRKFGKTIDQLRQMFMLENRYPLLTDFKRNVIDKAQKELKTAYENKQCDVWFDYMQEGKGTDAHFEFFIHTKEGDAQQKELWEDVRKQFTHIIGVLRSVSMKDKKYIDRVVHAMELDPEKVRPIFDKVVKAQKDFKGAELGKILRWTIETDFGIK